MRELHYLDQCEYMHGGLRRTRCTVRHHERVNGKPMHLIPVKEGGLTRFMCMEHAPFYSRADTVRKQKKKPVAAEQTNLLSGGENVEH